MVYCVYACNSIYWVQIAEYIATNRAAGKRGRRRRRRRRENVHTRMSIEAHREKEKEKEREKPLGPRVLHQNRLAFNGSLSVSVVCG